MKMKTRSISTFLLLCTATILLVAACTGADTVVSASSSQSLDKSTEAKSNVKVDECPVTEPFWIKPPDDTVVDGTPDYGYYYLNKDKSIWASAWWTGQEENYLIAGDQGLKMGWFRPAGAEMTITGRRLDGQAPPLDAHAPCCYPTRFQAAGILFPTEGCWEVTAKAEDSELSFIVRVEPAPTAVSAKSTPKVKAADKLSPALKMNVKRAVHTATLLPEGKVLITGGFRSEGTSEIPIADAEIFDPETNSFTPIEDMNEARNSHTATLLPNGKVLIAGGWGVNGHTATTELFDPQTGEFEYATPMSAPRASMTATRLPDGKVLIAGGDSARNTPQLTAEIYNPETNTFTQSGELNDGRSAHTATLLNDGTVLLIGGRPRYTNEKVLASAEIYNPESGQFTLTGEMNKVRYKHAAVLLQNGNVLVVGGSDEKDWRGRYASAEIYNSSTGEFSPIADMNRERFKLADAAVLLNDGDVLIGGGNRHIELFDAQNQRFDVTGKIDDDYFSAVLNLLQDGRVLITGGYSSDIQPSDKAWIYSSSS